MTLRDDVAMLRMMALAEPGRDCLAEEIALMDDGELRAAALEALLTMIAPAHVRRPARRGVRQFRMLLLEEMIRRGL